MVSTPLWAIPEVAAAQTQKEVTINNALVWLEGALADDYAITWTSNAATVGNNAFTQHMALTCPDNAASAVLTVPLLKKFFIVNNALGTHQVTVGGTTGSTVVVPSGAVAICLCDGTNVLTTTALAATAGVTSIDGQTGALHVAGNIALTSGTFTLSGMAAQAVPSSGIVVSDGTHVAAGTLGTNLAFSAGTLSLTGVAAESIPSAGLVYSTGTHFAAATLAGTFAFTGGTLSLTGVELTANKGAASGYAGLDSGGRVPLAQLPAALSEAIFFAGGWNANTGTTSLATVLNSGTGTAGQMFKVTTAGTTTLDGISQWNVGDQAVFSGVSNTWLKLDGVAAEVLSVGGATGAIGVAGNLSMASGTLTLSGMAAETVPAAGIVYSTGTHTASQPAPASGSLVYSNGTTLVAAAIGSGITFSGGTLTAAGLGGTMTTIVTAGLLGSATITTSGTINLPAPAAGIVVSDGTTISAGVLGSNLVFAAGTLSLTGFNAIATQTAPSSGVVISNGTTLATATIGAGLAFSGGTLGASVTLDGAGHVPFAQMQPELQNVPLAISHPGTMANSEVLMIVPVNQTLTLPSGLSGAYVITNSTSDLPAATTTLVLSTQHAGGWTAQGTLSVDTGGTLSVANGLTADATLVPGDGVRVIGQATADAQFGNFGLVVMLKKVAG